jgi:putative transposase
MNWKQLLASITGSVDEELRLRNAYLEAENRVMRHQIKARRVQLTDAERKTLTEMGHKLGRQALEEIATVAKPDTILAWHRTLVVQQSDNFQPCKFLGRPRIDQELEALAVRMARENRSWGYDRIVGALANLGYHISDQTVGNILKRHGIPPAPERKQTMTWTEFIRIHRDVLMATDFFTTDVWGWLGLVISSLLCCIHVGRRMIHGASMTVRLHVCWMLPISPRSPDWHADAERWIRSVTKPGLSRLLLCGACAWWYGLHGHMTEDHQEHLPRGMGQVVFLPAVNPHPIRDGPLRSRPRHSGRLQDDPREAA